MYNMNPWGLYDGSSGYGMMGYGPGYGQGGWDVGNGWWLMSLLLFAAPVIILLVLWSVFWKGLALWHSAQRGQYWWFVILLVVNTLGILEIIYLFFVAKIAMNDLFTTKHHQANHHH